MQPPSCSGLLPDLWYGLRDGCGALKEIKSLDAIRLLLLNAVHIALSLAGTLALIFIIIGGIRYITSQGSPDTIKSAKATIVHAVIGLALAVTAYLIVGKIASSLAGGLI